MYHGEHAIRFYRDLTQVDAETPVGGKDTWRDWHMVPVEKPVFQPPGEEEHWIKVPGRHGQINGAALLHGRPVYTNRTGELRFRISPYWRGNRLTLISDITTYLNGYERPCVLRDDPWFYYYGVFDVQQVTPGQNADEVTISYSLYPFKYERWNGRKDWMWDDLDFDKGVIREGYDALIGAAAEASATVVLELLPLGNEAQAELEILPGNEAVENATMELGGIPYYISSAANDPEPSLLADNTYQVLEKSIKNGRIHINGESLSCWIEAKYLIRGTVTLWTIGEAPFPPEAPMLLNGSHVYTAADGDGYKTVTGLRYPVTSAPDEGEDFRVRLSKTWKGAAENEWIPVAPYGAEDWRPLAGNGVLYGIGMSELTVVDAEYRPMKIETKETTPMAVMITNESPALPIKAALKYRGEIL